MDGNSGLPNWDDLEPASGPAGADDSGQQRLDVRQAAPRAAPSGAPEWNSLKPVTEATPKLKRPDAGSTNDPHFFESLGRGFRTTIPQDKELLGAAGIAAGQLIRSPDLTRSSVGLYQRGKAEGEDLHGPSLQDVIDGKAPFRNWAGNTLGNLGGQAVQSALAGAAGALAGGVAGSTVPGAGTAAGGIVGTATGLLGRKVVMNEAKKLAEKYIAEQVAKGVTKEAAEKGAATILKKAGTSEARKLGAVLGASSMNVGQEIGSAVENRLDQGTRPEEITPGQAARAVAAGTAAGALDTATELFNLGRLLHGKSANPSVLRRILAESGAGAAREGATEVAQSALERLGGGASLTDSAALADYMESGAAGVLGGGVLSAPAGFHRPSGVQSEDAGHPAGPITRAAEEADKVNRPFPGAEPGSVSDAANAVAGAGAQAQQPVSSTVRASETEPQPQRGAPPQVMTPDELTARAQARLAELDAIEQPTEGEAVLRDWLRSQQNNPQALAQRLGVKVADSAAQQQAEPAETPTEQTPQSPPSVPWIDATTGELRTPSDAEVKDAFHRLFQARENNNASMGSTAASRQLAREWQVPQQRLQALRNEAVAERRDGFRAGDARPEDQGQVTADDATPAASTEQEQATAPEPESAPAPEQDAQNPPQQAHPEPVEAAADQRAPSYDESGSVLDDDILASNGDAYKTRQGAERAAAKHDGGRVFETDQGFVIRQPQAAGVISGEENVTHQPLAQPEQSKHTEQSQTAGTPQTTPQETANEPVAQPGPDTRQREPATEPGGVAPERGRGVDQAAGGDVAGAPVGAATQSEVAPVTAPANAERARLTESEQAAETQQAAPEAAPEPAPARTGAETAPVPPSAQATAPAGPAAEADQVANAERSSDTPEVSGGSDNSTTRDEQAQTSANVQATGQTEQGATEPATLQNRDRSRKASILQMQAIAKNPDAARLSFSREPNTGAPMVAAADPGKAVPESDLGREDVVTFADGRQVPVRYAVVDANKVAASHSVDGSANPDYVNAPLQALNNGRTAGIQGAWQRGTGEQYRTGIEKDAAMLGISPEAIRSKKRPMVVRLYASSENTGDMGAASNAAANLGLSPPEQAATDARALPDLADLPLTSDGEISQNMGLPFHRKFLQALGSNEAARLVDSDGAANKTYFDRLRGALFAKAYGDPSLISAQTEEANPDARNVLNALVQAAPEWAKVDPNGPLGDYAHRFAAAMRVLKQARETGQNIEEMLGQGSLIERDTSGDDWALFFKNNARSSKRMGEGLREAARAVLSFQQHATSGDMFGAPKMDHAQLMQRVLADQEKRYGNPQQAAQPTSLFNAAGRPTAQATGQNADAARGRGREPGQVERTGTERTAESDKPAEQVTPPAESTTAAAQIKKGGAVQITKGKYAGKTGTAFRVGKLSIGVALDKGQRVSLSPKVVRAASDVMDRGRTEKTPEGRITEQGARSAGFKNADEAYLYAGKVDVIARDVAAEVARRNAAAAKTLGRGKRTRSKVQLAKIGTRYGIAHEPGSILNATAGHAMLASMGGDTMRTAASFIRAKLEAAGAQSVGDVDQQPAAASDTFAVPGGATATVRIQPPNPDAQQKKANKWRVEVKLKQGSVTAPVNVVGRYDSEAEARAAMATEKARLLAGEQPAAPSGPEAPIAAVGSDADAARGARRQSSEGGRAEAGNAVAGPKASEEVAGSPESSQSIPGETAAAAPAFRIETVGKKSIAVHGDVATIRQRLADAGFKKRGRVRKNAGGLRFDATDRAKIEAALGIGKQTGDGESAAVKKSLTGATSYAEQSAAAQDRQQSEKGGNTRGARRYTRQGQKRVEAAQQLMRQAINNQDMSAKDRADAIANRRNLVQYMEANAHHPRMETFPVKGDEAVAVDPAMADTKIPDGFEPIMWVEGHRAGEIEVRPKADNQSLPAVEQAATPASKEQAAAKPAQGDRVQVTKGKYSGQSGELIRAGQHSFGVQFDDGSRASLSPKVVQTAPAGDAATGASTKPAPADNLDAGEELWANRRNSSGKGLGWDDIADLNDTLKAKEATKTKIWPRPDYKALVDGGMPPTLAHVIKQVYDGIATKPAMRPPSDQGYRDYIAALDTIRNETFDWARKVMDLANSDTSFSNDAAERLGEKSKMDPADVRVFAAAMTLDHGRDTAIFTKLFPEPQVTGGKRANTFRTGEQGKINNALANLIGGNKAIRALQVGVSEFAKAKGAVEEGWPAAKKGWQRSFKIHKLSPGTKVYRDGKRETIKSPEYEVTRGHRIVASGFKTRAEAETAAQEAYAASRKKGGDGSLPEPPVALRDAREGPPRRKPNEDVTSTQLMDTFGFRGVNFGNWMKSSSSKAVAERQAHLNHAYDAFQDLAELLGLPAKAMSLQGRLGIAFGAQGKGGKRAAAAHFMPGVNEINLTRQQGAGSLAHEWAHALDHYFATQAGGRVSASEEPFLTEHVHQKLDGVRPEIKKAFQAIVDAMNSRPETQQERTERQAEERKRALADLEPGLASAREAIARSEKGDKDAALQKLDAFAARLRKGDVGQGYVKTGRGRLDAEPQVVGELATLVKNVTGRKFQGLDQLSFAARRLAYLADEKSDNAARARDLRKRSNYSKEARKLEGGRKTPYWSTNLEMFARAFQSYVLDKLAGQGARNNYLTRPQLSGEQRAKLAADKQTAQLLEAGDRYPRGVERETINQAFDTLIGEVKTREDEQGNVALFSLGESVADSDAEVRSLMAQYTEHPNAPRAGEVRAAVKDYHDTERASGGREAFEKARKDGKTKLNYRQWVQVRTKHFKQWFGDWETGTGEVSKVTDPDTGEPMPVYHGSPDARHDTFRPRAHFTPNPDYAAVYTHPSASSINSREKRAQAPAVYQTFLSIKRPFDTRIPSIRKQFEEEYSRGWGNRTPLSKRGLPDWTDARDLMDWIEETGQPYDGLILDEGGTPDGADRGISFVPIESSQIKSATANVGTFSDRDQIMFRQLGETTGNARQASPKWHRTVEKLANGVRARWNADTRPKVTVFASPAEFAEAFPEVARANPRYVHAHGFYDGQGVYLISSNLKTKAEVLKTLAHESIGHYGVERVVHAAYGAGAWDKIVASILRLEREGRGGARMQAVLKEVRARYGHKISDKLFAEETLAVMAEKGVRNGLLDRVVTAIRRFLRQIMPDLKLSRHELAQLLVRSERYLREGETYQQRVAMRRALAFSQADPVQSDNFKRWFGDWTLPGNSPTSRVVDAAGRPKVVHHGTADGFYTFDDQRLGSNTSHMTTPLGHFFAEDRTKAQRYAENASQGVPADERVIDAYLNIRKPKTMSVDDFLKIDSQDEARALRKRLESEGYDGIHMPAVGQWIAFKNTQIKSASENTGEYSPDSADIRFALGIDENAARRKVGIPEDAAHASLWRNMQPLKRHAHYKAAKAGDAEAAARLIRGVAEPLVRQTKRFGENVIYVAPHAVEASGENAIPSALANYLAHAHNAKMDSDIVQRNRTYHTGANAMQRLLARSVFDGEIQKGARYVLVDDVTTMGGTLADLAGYIRANGGEVAGTVVLTNASRSGTLTPDAKLSRLIERRFGDELRDRFQIDPAALTAEEARYLSGFRDADALRSTAAKAAQARAERLLSKGVRPAEVTDPTPPTGGVSGSGKGNFSLPAASIDSMDKVLEAKDGTAVQRTKAWLAGKWEDLKPTTLGALQLRHLLELMEAHSALKGAKQYAAINQQMDADRNQMLTGAADADEAEAAAKANPNDEQAQREAVFKRGVMPTADKWRKWATKKGLAGLRGAKTQEAKDLEHLMHQSTIYGLDPSREYEPLAFVNYKGEAIEGTPKNVKDRIKVLREQMLSRPGDEKSMMMDEVKRLRGIPKRERLRKKRWPEILAKWQALSPEAQQIYKDVRDWYAAHQDETEKALIGRIELMDAPETYRRSMIDRIRMQFESQRLEGVYFPLNRDGDYWLSLSDKKGEQGFLMFENAAELVEAEKKLRAEGYTIEASGRRDSNYRAKDAPSGTFVNEIIQMMRKAGTSEKVQDEVYQLFLKTLPEMSMRKRHIHRRAVPGYSKDALRAFAKNGFHGSYQLARLRHSMHLQLTLEAMQASMDNARQASELGSSSKTPALDIAKGDALLGELRKRHEWIMSPEDSQLANKLTSIGFVYYLGLSPASALVNLTQGAQVTLPVLAARHGWGKASRVLGAATAAALRTGGNIQRTLTSDDERRAYKVLEKRGDIDRTQSHTLAALAEGDALAANPTWTRVMNGVSWMFHKAEVVNREAAGMAAYRLARSAGKSFDEAVEYASEIINGTHFDYTAANRPRYMQNGTAKVLLQFKNYSVGMTWRLYRDLYQSFKGETPEVRREARRALTGILGVTTLMAGTMGLPIINALRFVANAAWAVFGDDDEPWDFDTEFRKWLAEHFGDTAASLIADGAVDQLGAHVSSRVSLSNLWFRDADRQLEGRDAYYNMLDTFAGPLGGLTKNIYVGAQQAGEGHIWRGVERMLPTAIKNASKALRFETQGVNTLRGNPIIEDPGTAVAFVQGLGFQPTKVAKQWRENSALYNYRDQIYHRRQSLMNGFAMAVRHNDQDGRRAALKRIRKFNKVVPEAAITISSLQRSLRGRARASAEARHGVVLSRRIARRVREEVGAEP